MACRLLRSLVTALTLAGPAVVATSAELQAPTMAPTTIMEKEMEGLRHDLNALAAEGRRIGGTADPAGRRALRGAHLARLRAAIASTRAMESRMHEALDRGQIASDRGARERHAFLLYQFTAIAALLEATPAETPVPDSACK